jgi:hypothetical protein
VFTPSIVPSTPDTVYLVEDDYGPIGRSFRETDASKADRETTLQDLLCGQYNDPVRIVAFNTSEGWSRDVSHEIAVELQRRADLERRELGGTLGAFVDAYTSPTRQLSLRLA